jgi:hypothetical protein
MIYWTHSAKLADHLRGFAVGTRVLIAALLPDGTIGIRLVAVPHGDPPGLSMRFYPLGTRSVIGDSMAGVGPLPLVMFRITDSVVDPSEPNAADVEIALAPLDLNIYASLLGEGFIFTDVHCSDAEEQG